MEEFWLDLILRLGFPIVVVLAMVKGYLVPGFIYDRVVQENERLTKAAEDKVIPLAVEGQQLLREALVLLDDASAAADERRRGDDPEPPRRPLRGR